MLHKKKLAALVFQQLKIKNYCKSKIYLGKQLCFLFEKARHSHSLNVWWFSLAKQLTRKEFLAIIASSRVKA